MKLIYKFRSMNEIELFELNNPGVLKTDPDANNAAREVFEAALIDKRKMFAKIPQETIDSMSLNQIDENLTTILGIEDWLEKHPALNATEAKEAAREDLGKKLAHAKRVLATTLQAIPGSIAFNASNKSIKRIAKIEQMLGENPEV
ncbi:MAG: hypothetical protein GX800_00620 [Clostridiaceae bacterium]|nr:hypothetical protein [Clostridiaceae bacterium]